MTNHAPNDAPGAPPQGVPDSATGARAPAPAALGRHAAAAGTVTLLTLAAGPFLAAGPAGVERSLLVAVPLVVVLGVPHGGADLALLLSRDSSRHGPYAVVARLLAYLAAAGAVVAAWMLAPLVSLLGFLVLSIWHFGEGDARLRPAGAGGAEPWLRGAVPVLAPFARPHDAQVVTALDALLPGVEPEGIRELLTTSFPLLAGTTILCAALVAAAALHARRAGVAAEAAALLAAGLLLPALVSFTLYFCCWHAGRHLIWLAARQRRSVWVTFLSGQTMTAAAVAFALVALQWLPSTTTATEATLRALFVGLAALTVPHAVLVQRTAAGAAPPTRSESDV